MKRISLTLFCLVVVTLACSIQVPSTAPAITPTTTKQISPVKLTATKQVAEVVQPAVNVRDEPGGAVIGSLVAGDTVTIVKCVGSWCQIKPVGWIFRGCLSDNPNNLGCTAK